ncbi:hypothetical protein HCA63_16070 [Listeria booriae]|uniref:toxin-antitoxin system YwqK family antitoxin n=1 Tax=Listeria booriae TaxID=1552123 RepID=UPI00162ADAE2|nr:hypothetical protein [Listeria booriae]MBC1889874.1 hypothetical protein [Listeria booriae]MBC1919630.1 hypothetical protein [Listeria booriae]MBC2098117.1 hypothetical protein [Listeria booriae]MBC2208135.1 hypothetical protein [Listeria booriae]
MQNNFLLKEDILSEGVNFEDNLGYGGEYDQLIVEYDNEENEFLYSGLAYDLYANGEVESYFFVKEGVKEGVYISFYENGNIKSKCNLLKGTLYGPQFEYYENGRIMREFDCVAGRIMKFTKFNKEGVIIEQKEEPDSDDLLYAKNFE